MMTGIRPAHVFKRADRCCFACDRAETSRTTLCARAAVRYPKKIKGDMRWKERQRFFAVAFLFQGLREPPVSDGRKRVCRGGMKDEV